MTTHGNVEIHDSEGSYLLHAFSDGHLSNTAHALLLLPGWIAEKRHFWIADMVARKNLSFEQFYLHVNSMIGWSADWAGDVVAALVGYKPLWWVPWNYKTPPPWFSEPDFDIYVTERGWRVVGPVPLEEEAVCFDFSRERLTVAGRIAELNERLADLKCDVAEKEEGDETTIAPFLRAAQAAARKLPEHQITVNPISDERHSLHIPARQLWTMRLWELYKERLTEKWVEL